MQKFQNLKMSPIIISKFLRNVDTILFLKREFERYIFLYNKVIHLLCSQEINWFHSCFFFIILQCHSRLRRVIKSKNKKFHHFSITFFFSFNIFPSDRLSYSTMFLFYCTKHCIKSCTDTIISNFAIN